MYSCGPPHMDGQKQDDQHEHTFSSYVRIQDVALKTYQRRWTIGRSGERVSEISVLAARHDNDDDNPPCIFPIYSYLLELHHTTLPLKHLHFLSFVLFPILWFQVQKGGGPASPPPTHTHPIYNNNNDNIEVNIYAHFNHLFLIGYN